MYSGIFLYILNKILKCKINKLDIKDFYGKSDTYYNISGNLGVWNAIHLGYNVFELKKCETIYASKM